MLIKKERNAVDSENNNNDKRKGQVVGSVNDNNDRTLIIGFSNCDKSFLKKTFYLENNVRFL